MSWNLDTAHSQIAFSVRHMMISKVRGHFEHFEGTFHMDEATPANSTVDVRIEAASINTRNEQRDGHLRSPDFLDAEHYPYVTFKSTRVEPLSDNTAKLYGDLTIRDITRPVVLDVSFTGQGRSPFGTVNYGFNASTTINRKDFNLTWNMALETGGVLVGDEIEIDIELELIKALEEQAQKVAAD